MEPSSNTTVMFLVDLWKQLIAPIILLAVGLGEFIYQAGWGQDQTFGLVGVGLALAGAGLGVDALTTKMGAR